MLQNQNPVHQQDSYGTRDLGSRNFYVSKVAAHFNLLCVTISIFPIQPSAVMMRLSIEAFSTPNRVQEII